MHDLYACDKNMNFNVRGRKKFFQSDYKKQLPPIPGVDMKDLHLGLFFLNSESKSEIGRCHFCPTFFLEIFLAFIQSRKIHRQYEYLYILHNVIINVVNYLSFIIDT